MTMNTRVGSGTLHRLVVDDDGQEGMIDLEAAVVFDESEFLELVHEEIHRERVVTIHFCQRLPSDPRQDGALVAVKLDLGSAPVQALEDLLSRLAAAGARDIRLA